MKTNDNNVNQALVDNLSQHFGAMLDQIEDLNRACSTVLENSNAIFLPHKRIDKTNIYKKFLENNQTLEIESPLFEKIEIKGRLLGQSHKDILEVLLTSPKGFYKNRCQFFVEITAYQILKKLGMSRGNKNWLIGKIDEIAECRIKIYYSLPDGSSRSRNFSFIDVIDQNEDKEDERLIRIDFTQEYTFFMIHNEMLDYQGYVGDIVRLESNFVKALVRYMLIHKGNNSQISIDNLVTKLRYHELVSKIDLKRDIQKLKKDNELQQTLKEKFGISLTNEGKTITFNKPEDKKHYKLIPQKEKTKYYQLSLI